MLKSQTNLLHFKEPGEFRGDNQNSEMYLLSRKVEEFHSNLQALTFLCLFELLYLLHFIKHCKHRDAVLLPLLILK